MQLVRADGVAVWGRTYDQPRAGLLELQDRIAEQMVSALRIELSPPERARLHLRYTDNPAAYDLYLRGRALLVNYTEAKMREAIVNFEHALALDQNYALARAALATATAWFSVRYAYEAEALAVGTSAQTTRRAARSSRIHRSRTRTSRLRAQPGRSMVGSTGSRARADRRSARARPVARPRSRGPDARLLPPRPLR